MAAPVYLVGGEDGKGLRITSKDDYDPYYRCGRLAVFHNVDGKWVGVTSKEIFLKGFCVGPTNPEEKVVGKVARTFKWKPGATPAGATVNAGDLMIDSTPIGTVVGEVNPLMVAVMIHPEWLEANKAIFEGTGKWTRVADPSEIKPGMKVKFGM